MATFTKIQRLGERQRRSWLELAQSVFFEIFSAFIHQWGGVGGGTHCKDQSFWRKTGRRIIQTPLRQRSGRPRRPCPGCPRRSPDKPSQRTQTASSSAREQRHNGARSSIPTGGPVLKRARRLHTIMTSAICFHCSGVGSVPVGLWAHACRTKMECSGQL